MHLFFVLTIFSFFFFMFIQPFGFYRPGQNMANGLEVVKSIWWNPVAMWTIQIRMAFNSVLNEPVQPYTLVHRSNWMDRQLQRMTRSMQLASIMDFMSMNSSGMRTGSFSMWIELRSERFRLAMDFGNAANFKEITFGQPARKWLHLIKRWSLCFVSLLSWISKWLHSCLLHTVPFHHKSRRWRHIGIFSVGAVEW